MAGDGQSLAKEQERPLDPDRLKRIVEYFTRPQGLYLVASGFGVGALQVTIFLGKDHELAFFLGSLVWGPVAFFAMTIWIPRYYTRRFGVFRQEPRPAPAPWKFWKRKPTIVVSLTLLTLFAGIHQIERVTHPPVDVSAFVFLLLFPWFLLVDGWSDLLSTLGIVLVTASAIALAVLHLLPLWVTLQDRPLFYWKLLMATSVAILLILIGLCDHLSLTQLLPREKAEGNHA